MILILFGLAALAPACYSSYVFIRKLFARWPRIRRVDWTWIGCSLAFLLIATSWPGRLEAVDHVMGIVLRRRSARWRGTTSRNEDAGRASGEVSILPASSPGVWG